MQKFFLFTACFIALCVVLGYAALRSLNQYQVDGEITFEALEQPTTIYRDEFGIPYIFASNMADAIRTQGFVVAQDRVFQVEMYRAIIAGRLAIIVGESGLESDVKMRVLGIQQNAERHAKFLDDESREYLQWYAQGYNAFVQHRSHEYPIELKLSGLQPQLVSVADLLAFQHFAGFIQSRNYEDEILSFNLMRELGAEMAEQLAPLNINPDRSQPNSYVANELATFADSNNIEVSMSPKSTSLVALPASGSNNWVGGNSKSENGMPILVNDPHLDASILPGPWYPVGIFTDEVSAVGANLPGLPGILLGRTQHVSFGVTNAYGDSQDLYLEKLDADNDGHYFDGSKSTPFSVVETQIAVKDKSADGGLRYENLIIRSTQRGPVISDHAVFGLPSGQPIVFRSAAAEISSRSIGFPELLNARSVNEADSALAKIDILYLNYLFADKSGGIGHRPTGAVPIRENGSTIKVATENDDWIGFIPKTAMPGQLAPSKDWLGTSNHDVIPDNYPFYYSTHFSPTYRYERTKEWLSKTKPRTALDHWEMLADVKNKHAERLTPIFVSALEDEVELVEVRQALSQWDFRDTIDSSGATIFHLTHEYLVRLMYEEKMSSKLFRDFIDSRYYWMQRTDELIDANNSVWFDLQSTDKQETAQDLIVLAALKAQAKLTQEFGQDSTKWHWGQYHRVSFVSPLRPNGLGAELLGGGTHAASGSGETLNRGQYVLNEGPYKSQWFSSLRMVADMSDDTKIMASMSGGNTARQFHPFTTSLLDGWLAAEWVPWWLDKNMIQEQSRHQLKLVPDEL